MVDATDFATPESALSAAIKIYVYGKLRATSVVQFVSSGTGSMLGGDIKHVGPSKFGAYTVALAKADLSDASAAWYDQYVFHMSAAGAAHQTIIVDGGLLRSYLSATNSDSYSMLVAQSDAISNVYSRVSDVQSYLVVMSGMLSDAHSAAILGASNASEAQSNALLILSRLSDLDSRLASDVSDILSATRGNSDALSDILSRINSASFLSDIASNVWAAKYTANSAASSFGSLMSDIFSRVAIAESAASDAASGVTVLLGRVPSTLISNINSMLVAGTFALGGSNLSDVGSAVWGQKYTAHSAASTFGSLMSDIYSRAGGAVTASDISDIASAVWATALATKLVQLNTSDLSDLRSAITAGPAGAVTASDISDIASAVADTLASRLSDILSAAVQTNSRVLVVQSLASDAHSAAVVAQSINASDMSDLRSAITGVTATVSASDISDIASAVRATLVSDLSDILSAAQQANSRVLVTQSMVSDVDSALTSQFALTSSMLSDIDSAVSSQFAATSGMISDVQSVLASAASDAAAVKAKTNNLKFTVASNLDVNIQYVNDVAVSGTGAAGDEWGPV